MHRRCHSASGTVIRLVSRRSCPCRRGALVTAPVHHSTVTTGPTPPRAQWPPLAQNDSGDTRADTRNDAQATDEPTTPDPCRLRPSTAGARASTSEPGRCDWATSELSSNRLEERERRWIRIKVNLWHTYDYHTAVYLLSFSFPLLFSCLRARVWNRRRLFLAGGSRSLPRSLSSAQSQLAPCWHRVVHTYIASHCDRRSFDPRTPGATLVAPTRRANSDQRRTQQGRQSPTHPSPPLPSLLPLSPWLSHAIPSTP